MKKDFQSPICQDCKHFRRHYIKDRRNSSKMLPLHYGHCTFPRCKPRDDDTPACKDFAAIPEKAQ